MVNNNVLLQSIILANHTIITHIRSADPIWFTTTWLIIAGIFILIVFILCHARRLEQHSNPDSRFELSRFQPNYCNTNGSTEIGGDIRHDH